DFTARRVRGVAHIKNQAIFGKTQPKMEGSVWIEGGGIAFEDKRVLFEQIEQGDLALVLHLGAAAQEGFFIKLDLDDGSPVSAHPAGIGVAWLPGSIAARGH